MQCSVTCLLKKPTFIDFLHGKLIAVVPFATAIIGITLNSETVLWVLIYVGIFLSHATHMYLRKCPHCAYYKISGSILKCHYIYGVPKLVKERSGAPGKYLRVYTPITVFIISVFPIYWLFSQWELLLVYILSLGVLLGSIIQECKRCIYFECLYNQVPEDVRKAHFDVISVKK